MTSPLPKINLPLRLSSLTLAKQRFPFRAFNTRTREETRQETRHENISIWDVTFKPMICNDNFRQDVKRTPRCLTQYKSLNNKTPKIMPNTSHQYNTKRIQSKIKSEYYELHDSPNIPEAISTAKDE